MSDVDLEEIARQIDLTLRGNLPQCLIDVVSEMISKDSAYYTAIAEPVPPSPLVPPSRYFLGHDPLIMERPLDEFPTVATMVHNHTAAGGGDNYSRIANDSFIEAFVTSEDPEESYRIACRYGKAIH